MEHNAAAYKEKYEQLIQFLRDSGFDNGITSYMTDMEYKRMTSSSGCFYINIKRIRFLRNKLVNESEQSFLKECQDADYDILDTIYDDFVNQHDPLTVAKKEAERKARLIREQKEREEQERIEQEQAEKDRILREEILARQREKEKAEELERQRKPDFTTFFAIFCIVFAIVLFVLLAIATKII